MAYWAEKDYTPYFLFDEPVHSPREIRAEYSRIRDILRKRAVRLLGAGFEGRAAYIESQIPKLADMSDAEEVANRLTQAHSLLYSQTFSLSGIKAIASEIFKETGVEIAIEDILDFNDYMKSWRISTYRYTITTNIAVALYYKEYREIGGTFGHFYDIYKLRYKT